MAMRKVRLARAVADANIATGTQDASAFSRDGRLVRKVMIDHRHKFQIGRAIRERKGFAGALHESYVRPRRFAARLAEHLPRRIDANDLTIEFSRQQFGK